MKISAISTIYDNSPFLNTMLPELCSVMILIETSRVLAKKTDPASDLLVYKARRWISGVMIFMLQVKTDLKVYGLTNSIIQRHCILTETSISLILQILVLISIMSMAILALLQWYACSAFPYGSNSNSGSSDALLLLQGHFCCHCCFGQGIMC